MTEVTRECMCQVSDRRVMLLTGRLVCELCPEAQVERDAVDLLMHDHPAAMAGALLGLAASAGKAHAEIVRQRAIYLWQNRH
jgi:hypothetical protein